MTASEPPASNSVTCYIDGSRVAPGSVIRRPMNFGQPSPGASRHHYVLSVDREAFTLLVANTYSAMLQGFREDEAYGEDQDPEISGLRAHGWPELIALWDADPVLLAKFLQKWMRLEMLDALLMDSLPASSASYALNSVNSIEVCANGVRVEGEALKYPRKHQGAEN